MAWKEEQEYKLMECVTEAFEYSKDPKKDYWINRTWRYFRDRLTYISKEEWLTFLAGLSDTQAYGKYTDKKLKECCIQVRNKAKEIIEEERSGENGMQVQTKGNVLSIFGRRGKQHKRSRREDLELSVRFG